MNIEEIKIISGEDKNGNREAVEELIIKKGDIIILAGPTGSGKSLLLSDLEQLANGDSPSGRRVLVNGQEIDPLGMQITASLSQNMHFMMDLDVKSFIELHAKSRKIEDENIVEKMLDMANSLNGKMLFILNKPGIISVAIFVSAAVSWVTNLILIGRLGITGAAWATNCAFISYAVCLQLSLFINFRRQKV